MVLLSFFWAGEYGFSTVGVGAILRNGCGIQWQNYVALVKRQQGFTTVVGLYVYNVIGQLLRTDNGVVVSELASQSSNSSSFPGRGEYNFTLQCLFH